MAAADYRLCDVCSGKVFYDSNLNYDFDNRNERGEPALDYLGDWAVICTDCAKTHECKVVPLAPADSAAFDEDKLLQLFCNWECLHRGEKGKAAWEAIIAHIKAYAGAADSAAERDAARWRYLREHFSDWIKKPAKYDYKMSEFDAAIDAAIAALHTTTGEGT